MSKILIIGGPLIIAIGFAIYSGLISFGEVDGMEHQADAAPNGALVMEHEETYQCDENGANCVLIEASTEFSEVDGLEIEQEAIEYRDGSEPIIARKLNGLNKYANITLRRPTGFDWKSWKFIFEREAAIKKVEDEHEEKLKEMSAEAEAE